jgi:hypothetical protein
VDSEKQDAAVVTIRVYVGANCPGCARAERLVNQLLVTYPGLDVAVIDLERENAVPDSLVALPTWYVNARVWTLGNPSWAELTALVDGKGRQTSCRRA